jgi:outer membrane protein assembly factor BamE (lipoprotein component of BamABCDE complex)
MRNKLVVWCSSLVLCGCAASGVKVTDEQAQSFKVGVATYSDVIGRLGPPTATSSSSGAGRTAVYSYSAVRSQPQNFIPYVGVFVAGYDTQNSNVVFTFDQRDVLTNIASNQGAQGVGANLAAGSNAASQPFQAPR